MRFTLYGALDFNRQGPISHVRKFLFRHMLVLRHRFDPRIGQYAFSLSGVEARGLLWAEAFAKLHLLGVRQPSRILRKAMQNSTIVLKPASAASP